MKCLFEMICGDAALGVDYQMLPMPKATSCMRNFDAEGVVATKETSCFRVKQSHCKHHAKPATVCNSVRFVLSN